MYCGNRFCRNPIVVIKGIPQGHKYLERNYKSELFTQVNCAFKAFCRQGVLY